MGMAIFFLKRPLLIKILVEALEAVEVREKLLFFQIPVNNFLLKILVIQHYTS